MYKLIVSKWVKNFILFSMILIYSYNTKEHKRTIWKIG